MYDLARVMPKPQYRKALPKSSGGLRIRVWELVIGKELF